MNISKLLRALAVGAVLATSSVASAAPISVGQWYTFGFGDPGSALFGDCGNCTLGVNPNSILAPAGPWTFTLNQQAELVVVDGFVSVDQFEIFNGGTSLGLTSAPSSGGGCGNDISCALGDLAYSRGVFALGPGSYSITGTHVVGTPGAAFLLLRAVAVPEPDILALLGLAAATMAFVRRRAAKGSRLA